VGTGISIHQLRNGRALGISVAVIDIAILVLARAAFLPLFAVSNIGRLLAGMMGAGSPADLQVEPRYLLIGANRIFEAIP